MLSRATNDLYPIRYFIGWGVVQVVSSLMMIVGVAIVLISVNARLMLYAGLTMPLIALLTWRFARLVTPLSRIVQQRKADLTEAADESVVGMEMVQAFGREAEVRERFRERAEGVRSSQLREAGVEARYLPGLTFLPSMAIASVLFFGGRDVIDGNLTIGQFVLFNSLLLQLVWPLEALGWILNLAQRAIASASRAFAWLDAVRPLPEPERPERLPEGGLDVRFDDVCFAYAGGSPVLRDLDLTVAAGSIVAVCGETGSGKSTMLNLLSRFYDPDSGSVRVGGVEASALLKADLRTAVALVTQRPVLFSLPLRDNLCAARPEATEDEMLAACEVAGVARLHRRPPRRLRHADRRARRQPLRRPAPARRARPCADLGRARPRARRSALGRRHRERGAHRRPAAPGARRADGAALEPAPLDRRRWPIARSCSRAG